MRNERPQHCHEIANRSKGKRVHAKSAQASTTSLTAASVADNVVGIRVLCDAGARVLDKDGLGFDALRVAATAGRVNAAREILARSPSPDCRWALHLSMMFGQGSAEFVSLLVGAKADVNEQMAPSCTTMFGLLFRVAGWRHRLGHSRLSTLGFHHVGATPLMIGIICASFDACATLVEAGAHLDLKNSRGKTARDLAAEMSAPDFLMSVFEGRVERCVSIASACSNKSFFSI